MTFVFRHPKFYRIPRDKSDQAISKEPATAGNQRSPGPGLKPQASSSKQRATSNKRQAPEATSSKQQASSTKPLEVVDTSIKP
jgi:hypothetical protein